MQQSLAATAVGIVIGYIAVQTGSIIPCMLFHMTYNGLMFATQHWPDLIEKWPALAKLFRERASGSLLYGWPVIIVGAVGAAVLLLWLRRLPYQATREEQISDARSRQAQQPAI